MPLRQYNFVIYSTLCKYAPPKETKIESVGFGFFFCRPGSLIARKKMIAFRKNSNARGSENASNKSRLMLHSSLRFIFAQAKAPVVSTNKKTRVKKP